jgi:GNAT superfamily N-acetyltransferase
MEIIELDPADQPLVSGAFEVLRAAHEADTPEGPPPHEGVFARSLVHPAPDEDEVNLVAVDGGTVIGRLGLFLPNRDNLHFAAAELTVHPEHRRRGAGTALLDRFIEHARAEKRTELSIETRMTWKNGPERSEAGRRFLERRGFRLALTCVNRRCAIDAMSPDEEQTLLDQAVTAAGEEYEILSWLGRTPTELVDSMCRLDSMILSEVPLGELELEPETVDPERMEARSARHDALGIVPVATVARHRATGEVVANTVVGVFDDPDFRHGFQWITIVDPEHRGHRLGTLVKVVNLRLLREQFPQVRTLWTDNADVNAHMIDINVKMGYESVDATGEFVLKLDA